MCFLVRACGNCPCARAGVPAVLLLVFAIAAPVWRSGPLDGASSPPECGHPRAAGPPRRSRSAGPPGACRSRDACRCLLGARHDPRPAEEARRKRRLPPEGDSPRAAPRRRAPDAGPGLRCSRASRNPRSRCSAASSSSIRRTRRRDSRWRARDGEGRVQPVAGAGRVQPWTHSQQSPEGLFVLVTDLLKTGDRGPKPASC